MTFKTCGMDCFNPTECEALGHCQIDAVQPEEHKLNKKYSQKFKLKRKLNVPSERKDDA